MGEYATYKGEQVKIGTCESMYYLRADQAHLVEARPGNVDPVADRAEIRFRFPFPDEDHLDPGSAGFEDFERGVRIPGGWQLPTENEGHYSVQFTSTVGYVLSIDCPEGVGSPPGTGAIDVGGIAVHRNGWKGGPVVRAQRFVDGQWWTVVACGACGAMWRLTPEQGAELAEAFLNEVDRKESSRDGWVLANSETQRTFLAEMASRILAGYAQEVTSEDEADELVGPYGDGTY